MIAIYSEAHAQSLDNEAGVASGHYDVELSEAGRKHAAGEKSRRYAGIELDAVFTSDLRRAYETAQIMFQGDDVPIITDPRLRECDYGDMTRRPRSEIEGMRARHVGEPFPNGESYEQAMVRMKDFLDDLAAGYEDKTVLIVGHIATHWGLEYWIEGVPLAELVAASRRYSSRYEFDGL